ncbi:FxLYD domain-containing protein [Halocalculus aciditolerans]|uniref:Uncharacterized protein n=1 Tax=Halocalculus aciditolerans TaxID=1383812 RepID=A0A830FHH3_9EURY|nr:FxLYD domain-containing protein [Halocalculus aciditolerans]GGL56556.1 hypothetical protein GCM10009039_13370 [Halocalculus aciditolerans]
MERRRFLSAAVAATATATTAGCLGGFDPSAIDWHYDYDTERRGEKLVVTVTGDVRNTAATTLTSLDVVSTVVRADNAPLAQQTKTLSRLASGESASFEFEFPFVGDRIDAVDGAVVEVKPQKSL